MGLRERWRMDGCACVARVNGGRKLVYLCTGEFRGRLFDDLWCCGEGWGGGIGCKRTQGLVTSGTG